MTIIEPGTTVMVIKEDPYYDTGVVGTVGDWDGSCYGVWTPEGSKIEADRYGAEDLIVVPRGTASYAANVPQGELLPSDIDRIDPAKLEALTKTV